jgi:hypothetical protein
MKCTVKLSTPTTQNLKYFYSNWKRIAWLMESQEQFHSENRIQFICMRNPIKNEARQKKEECSHTSLEEKKFERVALMRFRCRVASDGAPTWTPASLPSIDDENRSKCIDTETFHRGLGVGRFCCDVSTDVHWLSPERWAQDGARKDCFCRLAYCPWINNCVPSDKSRYGQR